jgi:hypothetical protein
MNLTVESLSAAIDADPKFAKTISLLHEHGDINSVFKKYLRVGTEDEIDGDLLIQDIFKQMSLDDSPQPEYLSFYETLIKKYFPENYKFLTLSEVEVPNNLDLGEASAQLNHIGQNISTRMTDNIELLSDPKHKDNPNIANAFAQLKDEELVVDDLAIMDHLKFIEMIKSVKLQDIYDDPHKAAVKIISYYLETHKSLNQAPTEARPSLTKIFK